MRNPDVAVAISADGVTHSGAIAVVNNYSSGTSTIGPGTSSSSGAGPGSGMNMSSGSNNITTPNGSSSVTVSDAYDAFGNLVPGRTDGPPN